MGEMLMQKLGIAREVRMRVTGHAPPRDGAASYEHHGFEREAFTMVEKLTAEIERIKGRGAAWGGGRSPGGLEKIPLLLAWSERHYESRVNFWSRR
ncbi:MAG: hypothetical protein EBT34_08270 [Acetobacteraceae bacterium]|jgi:hypothetical protein|nr:hypothetical protein [Acetobacteraceae bacterium]